MLFTNDGHLSLEQSQLALLQTVLVQLNLLIPSVPKEFSAGNVELDLVSQLHLHVMNAFKEEPEGFLESEVSCDLVYDGKSEFFDHLFGRELII